MSTPNLLNGYDMVAALTQNFLNSQIQSFTQAISPPPSGTTEPSYTVANNFKATAPSNDGWSCAEITQMAPAMIKLINNTQVEFRLFIGKGTVQYKDENGQNQTQSLNDTKIAFTADLILHPVSNPNGLNALPSVKNLISKINLSQNKIFAMLINFDKSEITNLGVYVLSDKKWIEDANFPGGSAQITTLGKSLANYFVSLNDSNPYILGLPVMSLNYAAVTNTVTAFVPTACDFNVSLNEENEGLSSLNYCMMTQNRELPSPQTFSQLWTTTQGLAGVFTIGNDLFVSGYVEDNILPTFQTALGTSQQFAQGSGNNWSLNCNLKTDRHGNLETDDHGHYECDQDTDDQTIVQKDNPDIDLTIKKCSQASVSLLSGTAIEITANGFIQYYMQAEEWSAFDVGKVEVNQPWTLDISIKIGTNGKFIVTNNVTPGTLIEIIPPSAGPFLECINWLGTTILGDDYDNTETDAENFTNAQIKTIFDAFQSTIGSQLDVLNNQFVLPDGSIFNYNNVNFNAEQDLQATIQMTTSTN